MKIAVIIATRGRPQRAAAVIECARNFMSGSIDVDFVLALDDDDEASINYFCSLPSYARMSKEVVTFIRPRPNGVGDCWNRAARAHKADFYLALPDDAWIIAPHWDLVTANVLQQNGGLPTQLGIVGWFDPAYPGITSIFSMAAKWIEMNGFIFDPRFPFWFGDTGLVETAIFATGQGMPQVDLLRFASKPGNFNPRMRDMELWWDLFAATRHERVETAREICRRVKLPVQSHSRLAAMIEQCEARDAEGRSRAPAVTASIERPAPPSEEYRQAKAAAEEYLRNHAIPAGQFRAAGD